MSIRCMLMRGGSSKGAYFPAADLPADPAERDDLLLRVLGSPDERQVDGIGGGRAARKLFDGLVWPRPGRATG